MAYGNENLARLKCKTGVISNLVDFGITAKSEDQYSCRHTSSNICSKYLLEEGEQGIYSHFKKECMGKDSCMLQNFDRFISRKGDA